MKLWVDDIRTPPDDWSGHVIWCKTSVAAIQFLDRFKKSDEHKKLWNMDRTVIDVMSLDHDLGGDDTTRPIVLWCCENDFWPVEVVCHSQNPVGRSWIELMIERYKS